MLKERRYENMEESKKSGNCNCPNCKCREAENAVSKDEKNIEEEK